MEIVTPDDLAATSKRAYNTFRQIGKIHEYQPNKFVEGKIYSNGWPAYVVVEFRPYRDGERTMLDISATSGDTLNRAADEAMYRFGRTFSALPIEKCVEPRRIGKHGSPAVGIITFGIAISAIAAAYYLGLLPFGQ